MDLHLNLFSIMARLDFLFALLAVLLIIMCIGFRRSPHWFMRAMRRAPAAIVVIVAVLLAPAAAFATSVTMTVPGSLIGQTIYGADGTQFTPTSAGQISVPIGGDVAGFLAAGFALAPQAGNGSAVFNPEGAIVVNTTTTGNGADTTEDTLVTYALPASSFNIAGKCVRVTSYVHFATNADTKTTKLYFGSEVIATAGAATSNKNGWLQLIACKTGSSTQIVTGTGQVDTTAVTPYVATGAETDTSAITIKLTGQAGTGDANDIVNEATVVEALN
jgi:hypothetical protein